MTKRVLAVWVEHGVADCVLFKVYDKAAGLARPSSYEHGAVSTNCKEIWLH